MSPASSQQVAVHTSQNGVGFTLPLTRVRRVHEDHRGKGQRGLPTVSGRGLHAVKEQLRNADSYTYLVGVRYAPFAVIHPCLLVTEACVKSIGGQSFDVILDTGSSDLWVTSSDCRDDGCGRLPKYTRSSTLESTDQRFDLQYLTADVSGTIGLETVLFGRFEVASQVIALVDETRNMSLTNAQASGVLGLGFPSVSAIPLSLGRTLLETVFSNLPVQNRFFAYKLSPSDTGGTLSIGQHDPTISDRAAEIFYTPAFYSPGEAFDYWKLQLRAITVNGRLVPDVLSSSKIKNSKYPIAVLDTGTTLILGPSKDVNSLWAAVGGARLGDDGRWRVRCEHAVSVGLALGDQVTQREYLINPADVSQRPTGSKEDEEWCIGGVQSNDGVFSGDWILGDAFLRNVYVVHQSDSRTSPPLIGLLSTASAPLVMNGLQSLRRNDTEASPGIKNDSIRHPNSSSLQPWALLLLSGLLAFVGSMLSAVLIRVIHDRMISKRAKIGREHGPAKS